ncbi:carbohydrate-binding domain-containing protein [Azospirillum canadense]|uniref:carbohydrate-binding domain-containing protein n=1 Tax=Azospirillum canadense TaxID=403962 RepID=UPI002225D3CA|nr:carbohydrate-binding domain-containing protein [Azospirillum canadense]MCW2238637.1 parallel beta-helix repeat protein [Azospirillum canadense]
MADLYVSTTGSDSGNGTKDSPFRTIAKASQAAGTGTTVHVANGTYQGGFSTSANGVTYVSDTKYGAKIVAPSGGADMAWSNSGSNVTINGFEVSGSSFRIGLYTTGSNSVIENSKVHDIGNNLSGTGGAGIYADSYSGGTNMTIKNNEVYNVGPAGTNSSLVHAIYHSSTGTIANNLVYDNAGVGIHLWHDAHDLTIVNNTTFNNYMGAWIGADEHYTYSGAADNIKFANNIVYDNRAYGVAEGGTTGTHNTYTNNLVYDNSTDFRLQNGLKATGTVASDPKFVKYVADGGGDYHLAAGSPAINAGTSTNAPTTDMSGASREGAVDIGAYEYKSTTSGGNTPTAPSAPSTPTTPTSPTAGSSTITVNASGNPAGGVNAHFNLLIDGKKVGEGMAGTTAKDFTFTTNATADQAHKVQVQYDNDGTVNGQDRNLMVNKITINGHAVNPTDSIVSYDKGALDGQDVVKGQSGMWWNGTLAVSADKSYFPAGGSAPTAGSSSITVNASGNAAGGVNAHFNLLVDGKKVGEGVADTTAKDYTFKTDLASGQAHKVQVQYDNDGTVNGQDRNLTVNKVTINGHASNATDANVSYDKGALDGQDVVKGQSGMWWNGTLVVSADKSWFPASATTAGTATAQSLGDQTDVWTHIAVQNVEHPVTTAVDTQVASVETYDHGLDAAHLLALHHDTHLSSAA